MNILTSTGGKNIKTLTGIYDSHIFLLLGNNASKAMAMIDDNHDKGAVNWRRALKAWNDIKDDVLTVKCVTDSLRAYSPKITRIGVDIYGDLQLGLIDTNNMPYTKDFVDLDKETQLFIILLLESSTAGELITISGIDALQDNQVTIIATHFVNVTNYTKSNIVLGTEKLEVVAIFDSLANDEKGTIVKFGNGNNECDMLKKARAELEQNLSYRLIAS